MERKPGHLPVDVRLAVDSLVWVKIVGIGSTAVGKTCLIKHFCESKFNTGYQPTVGVDYGFKIHEVEGTDLRVHLWDLSGSTEYMDVRNELYGGTDAMFLAYDVTNAASFETLDSWIREVKKYSSGTPEIVIVANKTDLKQKRCVSTAEGKKWASQNKMRYYETSAATGEGVVQLFGDLLKGVYNRREGGKPNSTWSQKWDAQRLSDLCSPLPDNERGNSARV
ncbi:ras-related protein Rab-13-like [Haliotis rubra]|uniref:ras-related protein Rab-13-like n=1 Tax=Haliotis rubra TaxID=36100 RepID=UPI001EE5C950|nr:ras-related protein Rab-13-like [Haliotis rubra]